MRNPFFYFLAVLCFFPAKAMAGEGVPAGNSGIRGDAVSYVDIMANSIAEHHTVQQMPCYRTRGIDLILQDITTITYNRLDENGNTAWSRTYSVEPKEIYRSLGGAQWFEEEEDVLDKMNGEEIYRFYKNENRNVPSHYISTDSGGKPLNLVEILMPSNETIEIALYDLSVSWESLSLYETDGRLITSQTEVMNGDTTWRHNFHYHKNKTLRSTELIMADGRASNRTFYDKHGRTRKQEIFNRAPEISYTIKTRNKGSKENYTSITRISKGKPNFDFTNVIKIEDGRIVLHKNETRIFGSKEDGSVNRREIVHTHTTSHSHLYDENGRHIGTDDRITGSSNRRIYHQDAAGNMTMTTLIHDNAERESFTTLRSVRYRNGALNTDK